MSEKKCHNSGLGFFGATFIALMVLKLTGEIDWSWFAVAAPLGIYWFGFIIGVSIVALTR